MKQEKKAYQTVGRGRHGRREPVASQRWLGWSAMVLAALLVFSLLAGAALAATSEVRFAVGKKGFAVGGQNMSTEAAAFVKDGRAYVPVRGLAQALGLAVGWDGIKKKVTVTKGEVKVELVIGNKEIVINGRSQRLGAAPVIRAGRAYVPAREIAESLGYQARWDAAGRAVVVMPAAGQGPAEAAQKYGLSLNQAYHNLHAQQLGVACTTCHVQQVTGEIQVFSGQDVSPAAPGPVDRKACLACHTAGPGRKLYGR
ncbi:MAG: hypothetical protein D9V47_02790 [Clostridia bacterium]|nr:MAG: hypothetical protein D9V47_02790 [Clostridia bacterium]